MPINRTFLILEGIVFVLLGLFAIAHPYITTLGFEFVLGIALVAAGVIQGIRSLINIKEESAATVLIAAAFALIAGILLLTYPLTGILTLTLLITAFLVVDGISKIVNGFQLREFKGWGALVFSGVISLILAALIYQAWPISATWVIGIYLGVYWIFLGISLLIIAFYFRKAYRSSSK